MTAGSVSRTITVIWCKNFECKLMKLAAENRKDEKSIDVKGYASQSHSGKIDKSVSGSVGPSAECLVLAVTPTWDHGLHGKV